MELIIVNDLLKIIAVAVMVLLIFGRLKIPAIVGFLVTGILAGPHGFGLIEAVHEVEIMAEIGIVFLLFSIGIHFSIKELLRVKRSVIIGGALQIIFTTFTAYALMRSLGWGFSEAVFAGWLLALSSTAIVLKLLEEQAEMDTPHGRNTMAILIFQDIIIFPMILFTPLLAGIDGNPAQTGLLLIVKVVVLMLVVVVGARYVVPGILYQIVRTRSRELFLLSVVLICFAVAWLTSYAGLSLSLGAFLAGLIISESDYSHEAMGNILPFRDLFLSLFFVSVGMLLDFRVLLAEPVLIVIAAIVVIFLKAILAALATFILGFPFRTCVIVGMTLGQVGEFSFILSKTGIDYGLLTRESYQLFLSVSLLTMAATPFVIAWAPRFGDLMARLPLPARLRNGLYPLNRQETVSGFSLLSDHLIIAGYGLNGHNVAKAAKTADIPYVIIEMNPDTVRNEKQKGEPVFYGDAAEKITLEHAGVKKCRVLVIAISDAAATRKITVNCKRNFPHVHIIARTRFLTEMQPLHELGADAVIPEEFETSVEIFTLVLAKYLIPRQEIEKFIAEIRSDRYRMFRTPSMGTAAPTDLKRYVPDLEISTFRVPRDCEFSGKTLAQLQLPNRFGATILIIRRDEQVFSHPDASMILQSDDMVTVFGNPAAIAKLDHIFHKADA
jgi:CPA2 family monovalent cation:H+ antiporter-2